MHPAHDSSWSTSSAVSDLAAYYTPSGIPNVIHILVQPLCRYIFIRVVHSAPLTSTRRVIRRHVLMRVLASIRLGRLKGPYPRVGWYVQGYRSPRESDRISLGDGPGLLRPTRSRRAHPVSNPERLHRLAPVHTLKSPGPIRGVSPLGAKRC